MNKEFDSAKQSERHVNKISKNNIKNFDIADYQSPNRNSDGNLSPQMIEK